MNLKTPRITGFGVGKWYIWELLILKDRPLMLLEWKC
jgi:hypothetical protein